MTAEVYSTIPATIRMKLELASDGGQSAEVDSINGHTGSGWETLTFNFAGTNAIDANFDVLVLFPNFGVVGAGNTYQYDNVTFAGGTVSVDVPGCTNPDATNYNASATSDDGSCTLPVSGDDNAGIFSEAFGGTTIGDGGVYTFPSGAESWAGFANMNTALYPMSFSEAGSITFNGSVADGGSADIRFRLEYNPHPDTEPSYDAATVTVSGATPTSYTVAIPSQGANTFSSLIMYVVTQDVGVTVTDVVVSADAETVDPVDPVDPSTVSVTFQVDMSAVDTHPDGVYLAGGGVFGQDGLLMTDNGSDVWSVTAQLDANTQVLYKFRNQPSFGTWDGFEDATGLAAEGCSSGAYNDRFVDVAEADITLPVVAYGSCTADPYVSTAPAVSFTVTAEGASEVKFHSSGFGWDAGAQVVAADNGDGTWTAK